MQALLHVGKMLASTIFICEQVKHMVHGEAGRSKVRQDGAESMVATESSAGVT